MSKLGVVEDTLFVPMLGRIYASEHYPQIYMIKKHWKDDRFLMVENDRFDYMYSVGGRIKFGETD